MIITTKKETSEILESLKGQKKVHLFGCDSCAEQCQTGGRKELDQMKVTLEENGFTVTGDSLVDETCYNQLVRKEFRLNKSIKEADSFLILSCGAGVKTVADNAEVTKPVIPALDSVFLATVERYGRFFEGCSLCGDCVLGDTGGICPHTECPKSLLNGPCGGVVDGKCEVDVTHNCAWVDIYNRLKEQDRLHVMTRVKPPKDHAITSSRPRHEIMQRIKQPTGKRP